MAALAALHRVALVAALGSGAAVGGTTHYYVNSIADVPANGATGVCQTAPDNSTCTLRAAVMAAAATEATRQGSGESVVIHVPAGTYTMTAAPNGTLDGAHGCLFVPDLTTIAGAGAASTILDANTLDRELWIKFHATATVSGVTIRHGKPATAGLSGGGIFVDSYATVVVDHCLIEHCDAPGWTGGGIESYSDEIYHSTHLTVLDSTIRLCSADYGAGIHAGVGYEAATTNVSRSNIVSNTAAVDGGGMLSQGASISVDHSTIAYNSATTGNGGGIKISSFYGTLRIWNTTIAWNASSLDGGGLYVDSTPTNLSNVTICGNSIGLGQNPNGDGGGLFYVTSGGHVPVMANSILRSNSNDAAQTPTDCNGPLISNGYNIVGDTTNCAITGTTSQADPILGLYEDNGGGFLTFEPGTGSPAIGGGDPSGCTDSLGTPLTDDQRGVVRPIGAHCDLGALEVEPVGDVNGDGTRSVADVFYLVNFLFAGGPVPKGRANVNGDGTVDISDVFYLVNFLFAGGPPPVS